MSLTLSATFDEPTGTVALQATSDTDWTYGNYAIVRADANGTATVRTQEDLDFSGGELNVIDSEPALSGWVSYTIVAGAESATDGMLVSTARTWLKFPLMPHLSIELAPLTANYEGTYTPTDRVFNALDREDPIIVFGTFGMRSGSFEIICDSYGDALAIVNAYRVTRVSLLQNPAPAEASMYHAVSELRIEPFAAGTSKWALTGRYTEVSPPVGPVLGTLGWDYNDVGTGYSTFTALVAAFDSFNDLTVGV